MPERLHPEDFLALVEATASRVVELLRDTDARPRRDEFVTARDVASRFGVSEAWVREHKAELGAVPLGNGPKPRLRFDLERVAEALASRQRSEIPPTAQDPVAERTPRRRAPARQASGARLLTARGPRS